MRPLASTAAALAALILPSLAVAQGPATVRGIVYSCSDGTPIPSARVTLYRLDDGSDVRVTADAQGRFARVGLTPGRYLVIARANAGGSSDPASRFARLSDGDVLDMTIGTERLQRIGGAHSAPIDLSQPHPRCDAAVVPPAPPTTGRYIIQ